VAEKGMPAWAASMKEDEMNQATVFVATLKGTNPAGAKAPQGVEVK
jgi:cytochrome c oxidase cbb3-type subunit 3